MDPRTIVPLVIIALVLARVLWAIACQVFVYRWMHSKAIPSEHPMPFPMPLKRAYVFSLGLGHSAWINPSDVKQYFGRLFVHENAFVWADEQEGYLHLTVEKRGIVLETKGQSFEEMKPIFRQGKSPRWYHVIPR